MDDVRAFCSARKLSLEDVAENPGNDDEQRVNGGTIVLGIGVGAFR